MEQEPRAEQVNQRGDGESLGIHLRLGKGTNKGIGGRRSDVTESLETGAIKRKNGQPMKFRSNRTKRGREANLFPLIVTLVCREYDQYYGDGFSDGLDPDHILGRNAPGFKLGAMLDPENIQLLTRTDHVAKTNGAKIDYRTVMMKEKMTNLSKRIQEQLGPAWNLEDLKKALENMIENN